jgi:K+-transporting ATPase A subunit
VESILSGIHPFWALALPIAGSMPIGLWMARALDPPADRVGRGRDALPRVLFSEILYEFTSAAANNGSGFEGLADNNPSWNVATGTVLLLGRFSALIFPLAIAGFLSQKKRVPHTVGTLRTDNLTSAGMLSGTALLVGALSFVPAAVLGPIADHLMTVQP